MTKAAAPIDFHVLIPAAGQGSRIGGDMPKQFQRINGKTILRHTIERFLSVPGLKSLRVIIDPDRVSDYHEAVQGLSLENPIHGGETRKSSVQKGLKSFSNVKNKEIIVVHDAARPLFDPAQLIECIRTAKESGAATLSTALVDTTVDKAGYKPIDRNHYRAIQTPQAFQFGLLKQAHETYQNDNSFTDDAGMVAALGCNIIHIDAPRWNFKITTPEDMMLAEKLLTPALETRTGFGFDIHRFADEKADAIKIGGVDIPYSRQIDAHSDGDVILHALTDAVLGTFGGGDIGQLFPPSDKQWKNANSRIFITEALKRLRDAGGRLIHADISLQAQSPKIGPHRDRMIAALADMLGLPSDRIGLKATTMEKLGPIGREEGLAAQVVVTVVFPR